MSVVADTTGWISCPGCSRRARIGQGFCEMCGRALREAAPTEEETRREHSCDGCGAVVLVPEGERTTTCAFCGAPYVRVGEVSSERFAPEFVVPFSVGRRQAEKAYRSWFRQGGLFCPGDLREKAVFSGLRGVYIPFWSFSMRSESTWHARIGEYWWETITETYTTTENGKTVTKTRTRRVRHTEWYPLSGQYRQFHSRYLVSGSKGLPQEVADHIQPFPVSEATRYAPHYLAGWLCEEYTLSRDEAARISMEEFRRKEKRDVAAFMPGDTQSGLSVSTTFHDATEDLLLLPLWIFAYVYRGKTYRFAVNGATGAKHGEKPVSTIRIVLLILALLGLAGLIALLIWLMARGH